jgi:rhamnose transport system permease protein
MVMGMLGRDHPGTPVAVLLAAAVGVGMACGLVNGVLVALLGVPSIIATLGTLAVFRGLTFLVSDNVQVDPEDVPRDVLGLAARSPFGAAWLFWFAAAVALLVWWVTSRTLTGRRCYAIGSSPEAATARGLGVRRHTLGVFVLVGALSGLGGAMYVARYATVNPADAGVGFELTVISAVVIGGANIFGGSGSVLGTLFGCALVGVLANALTVLGVSTYWQSVSAGVIILLAVIVDSLVRRRLDAAQALRRRVRT